MAITETQTKTTEALDNEPLSASKLDVVLGSSDHKTIGRLWLFSGFLLLAGALIVSVVAAAEALSLGSYTVVADADQFTQLWSLGREVLFFGGVVPILIGLAVFLVPLQVGASTVAFARGASASFWTWLFGMGLVIAAYIANGGAGGGRQDFIILWAAGLAMAIFGILWSLVIIATTVLAVRTPGMTLDKVPFTAWGFFVFALVGLLNLPVLIVELALTYTTVSNGLLDLTSSSSLTGVADMVSLSPALYWLAIPCLAMMVDIVGVHTSKAVAARQPVMVALAALGVISFGANFLSFASVRPVDFNNGLWVVLTALAPLAILAVLALSVPSLGGGKPTASASLGAALASSLVFALGAALAYAGLVEPITLFLAENTSLDIDITDTLVLHGTTFHDAVRGLIIGAAVVAVVGAIHHWSPKLWGKTTDGLLTTLSIASAAAGALAWGVGALVAGIDDQAAYPVSVLTGGDAVEAANLVAMVGIGLVALGALVAAANTVFTAVGGSSSDADDPWIGSTLEWATASPPSFANFDKPLPVFATATPMVELNAANIEAAGGETESEEA